MTTARTTQKRTECPACETKAKRVGTTTLLALLKDEFADDVATAENHFCRDANDVGDSGGQPASADAGWRFCDAHGCDVVYFSEQGHTTFTKSQLKVPVGVKGTTGERPLCYCFGHSIASIKDELRIKGRSDALEDVRQKMNDPGCLCETKNPSGWCCLGSVGKGIPIAQEEMEMKDSDMNTVPTPATPSSSKGEKIAKIGTLLSAIMVSACYWLPLVLLAVGVSGAGIAATLEAYRPLFIVVTFGFLGAAFYFTYRPRKAAAGGEQTCCTSETIEAETYCPPAGKGHFSMLAFNKIMLWVVTVLAVAFLFFPSYVGALFGERDAQAVTTVMNRVVLKVEGMTCAGCSVAKAIRRVPGVLAVAADYKQGEAVVGTEICCPIPTDKILAARKDAGYGGKIVEGSVRQAAPSTTEEAE